MCSKCLLLWPSWLRFKAPQLLFRASNVYYWNEKQNTEMVHFQLHFQGTEDWCQWVEGYQSKFQEPISLFIPKIQLFCSSILYRLHFYYISHFFSQSMKGDERNWDYLFLPKENSDVKYFKVTTTASFQNPYFQQRILGNATRTPLSIVHEHCCHILLYIVMFRTRGILLR